MFSFGLKNPRVMKDSTERPIEDDERVSLIVDFASAILVRATPPEP
jgi:hypothetical protein